MTVVQVQVGDEYALTLAETLANADMHHVAACVRCLVRDRRALLEAFGALYPIADYSATTAEHRAIAQGCDVLGALNRMEAAG